MPAALNTSSGSWAPDNTPFPNPACLRWCSHVNVPTDPAQNRVQILRGGGSVQASVVSTETPRTISVLHHVQRTSPIVAGLMEDALSLKLKELCLVHQKFRWIQPVASGFQHVHSTIPSLWRLTAGINYVWVLSSLHGHQKGCCGSLWTLRVEGICCLR
jgi:hypothetical protein